MSDTPDNSDRTTPPPYRPAGPPAFTAPQPGPPTAPPQPGPPTWPPTGPPTTSPSGPPTGPSAWQNPEPLPADKAEGKHLSGPVVVIALLIAAVVVIVVAGALLSNDKSNVTMTVQECSISSDGTVVASGILRSTPSRVADVKVSFTDADTATRLGTGTRSVKATPGGTAWDVSIHVGEQVQRVTCTATT